MIQLRHAVVRFLDWGVHTQFLDGSGCCGAPNDDAHYAVISHRCGYGDDLLRYAQEHDLAHNLVEQFLHDRPSQVLWGLAHNAELPGKEAAYEELMAQTLQRYVRAAEEPIIGGVEWGRLRDLMRAAVRDSVP